ncbi:MAG: hypothetical protein KTR24_02500 [Saprospiraceae bacterium]|nr:hypothetical protein [Saprospiraceae bacterium]
MRFIGFVLLLGLGCHPRLPAGSCSSTVKVVPTELDGCTYLLHTDNGDKLLPLNGEDYDLGDYNWIRIDFEEVPDGMSICMAEDKIIRITCFDADHATPRKKPCLETLAPLEDSTWLTQWIKEHQPTQVDRYTYLDGFAYLCKTGARVQVYDCQGNLLCDSAQEAGCKHTMTTITNKVNIWTAHR